MKNRFSKNEIKMMAQKMDIEPSDGFFFRMKERCEKHSEALACARESEKEVTMNKTEELIGIFGTLCDYMVDNGRCDVFCPYAETKDKDDECEAWRTIQKIRQEESK